MLTMYVIIFLIGFIIKNKVLKIVKPVYDNGYIDIYSNEFEIK